MTKTQAEWIEGQNFNSESLVPYILKIKKKMQCIINVHWYITPEDIKNFEKAIKQKSPAYSKIKIFKNFLQIVSTHKKQIRTHY